MVSPLRNPSSNEDIFVARYSRLLAWARQIVGGDRETAEDLVHDAFFNVTASRRELATIDNVDGYLFAMLRNLHVANVRRGARRADAQTPLVEYASAAEAIQAFVPTRVHDELVAICHYVCVRRVSSKAGSVLILRFFHGYQAAEIARLLRVSADAVDNLLRLGRRETRVWLQDPQRLRFLQRANPPLPRAIGFVDPANLLRGLQNVIFDATHDVCPSETELRASYQPPAEPVACPQLAHIVSCRRCLDVINDTLGLPKLADRHADDGIGPGTRPPRDSGGGAGTGGGDPVRLRRRAQQLLRRRPAELRIAANGHVVGWQQVSGARMSQQIVVQSTERLGFVEVLDERHERLFLMSVEPPPEGAIEQVEEVSLSDGRELSVSVSFAGMWPSIALIYDAGSAALEAAPTTEASRDDDAPAASAWTRLRWRLTAWAPRRPRVLRPALVVFAVLLLLVLVGPHDAWSAVVHIGRTAVQWVVGLVTDRTEPESGHRDETPAPARRSNVELLAPAVSPAPMRPLASAGLSEAAMLGLEVEILQRLDGIDALYGEGLSLARQSGGRLRLEGTVRDGERRRELTRALGALVNIPQLHVRVRSAAEGARSAGPTTTAVRTIEVTRDRSSINEVLAQRLLERGLASGVEAEEAARALATRVVNASRRALRHAWAFATIARQVPDDRLRELHEDAHKAWRGLLARHATGVSVETAEIERELDAVGLLTHTSTELAPSGAPGAEASVPEGEHLVALVERQEQSVRALFVVAPDEAAVEVPDALSTLASQLRASQTFARHQLDRRPLPN